MFNFSDIPNGYYCYKGGKKVNGKYEESGICPYWSEDLSRDEHERGYCAYLQKGDWDMNNEEQWQDLGPDEEDTDSPWQSAASMGLLLSDLWDKVKAFDCPKWPGKDK